MSITQDMAEQERMWAGLEAAKRKGAHIAGLCAIPGHVATLPMGEDLPGSEYAPGGRHEGEPHILVRRADVPWCVYAVHEGPFFRFVQGWEAAGGPPLRFVFLPGSRGTIVLFRA